MSDRDKRMKASDVFMSGTPLAGERVSFSQAYPQIEDVTVEVQEYGRGVRAGSRPALYGKQHIREFIDCSNSLCYNGGFSLGSILSKMVWDKQTELKTSRGCRGYEGSPKGKRKYRDCTNTFEIKVNIKYKEGEIKNDVE